MAEIQYIHGLIPQIFIYTNIVLPFHITADMDECSEGTDACTELQVCTNTEGSFQCDCFSGYSVSANDSSLCEGGPYWLSQLFL